MKPVSWCKSFEIDKKFLASGKFYPTDNPKTWHRANFIFILLISCAQFFSMIIYLFSHISNVTKISENLLFCVTQFAFLSKLFNFWLQRHHLIEIEDFLNRDIFVYVTQDEDEIVQKRISRCRSVARIFRILCFLTVSFYAAAPLLDQVISGGSYRYPLPCYFPFNPDRYHLLVLFVEVLSIAVGAWCNSNIDILAITLVTLACGLFDVLSDRLRKGGSLNLRDCAVYYAELLRYADLVQRVFSAGIFVQFVCSATVICLTGFQMLVIPFKSVQFVQLFVYFSCMMCQVVMYCWYGQNLAVSSEAVTTACYFSGWEKDETSRSYRKSLIFVMERAKRRVQLTAGNFFALNLATLMTILRSSYSYFALLQRLYGK